MAQYLLRRILIGCFTLLLITFVVYALIRAMPGDPMTYQMAITDPSEQIDQADYERMKRTYGLDKPWPIGYVRWARNALTGNFDVSFFERKPVIEVIGQRIGPTLLLSATSLLLTYLISVPLGLFATARSGRGDERFLSTGLYMLYSLPNYVAALLLLVLFSLKLAGTPLELPLFGMTSDDYATLSPAGKVIDVLRHMILPVFCFTYASLAYFTRFVKSNMMEVMRQDYIRTARAKGVDQLHVITRHAFPNTMIPFVTLIGLTLPAILSGSVILEQIFSWPGMGKLFLDAILRRDYPVIMGLTLISSFLVLLGQLLADILYAVVDPRISY